MEGPGEGAGDPDVRLKAKTDAENFIVFLIGRAHEQALILCKQHESKEAGGSVGRASMHLPLEVLHTFYKSKLMQVQVFRDANLVMDKFILHKQELTKAGMSFTHAKDTDARSTLLKRAKRVERRPIPRDTPAQPRGKHGQRALSEAQEKQAALATRWSRPQRMQRLLKEIEEHEKAAKKHADEAARKRKEYNELNAEDNTQTEGPSKRMRRQ